MTVIEAMGLTKLYEKLCAVDAIDFTIRSGECFGFLGPNGAGKSTTVKMIHCFAPVISGWIVTISWILESDSGYCVNLAGAGESTQGIFVTLRELRGRFRSRWRGPGRSDRTL